MSQRKVNVPPLLVRLTLGVGFLVLSYWLLTFYLHSQAQSTCASYNHCAALEAVSSTKVQGPITYWFDNERIDALLSPDDANNFRDRLSSVCRATKTGVLRRVFRPRED